jgi:hypothetical protein
MIVLDLEKKTRQEWGFDPQFKLYVANCQADPIIKDLSDKEELRPENEQLLSKFKVEQWHAMVAGMPSPNLLRCALMQHELRLKKELEKIDRESNEHRPTYHFRQWLQNKFYYPSDPKQIKNSELGEHDPTLKEGVEEYVRRVRERSQEFRDYFGGSTGHRCGGCERNEPCDVCGERYPLEHFSNKKNSKGFIVTSTKNGKEYIRWMTRCSNVVMQNIGMHICSSCGLRHTTLRMRQVELAQSRKRKQGQSASAMAKYVKNPDAFPKFTPRFGKWQGIEMQLVVKSDTGKRLDHHVEETPYTGVINVELVRTDTVEVLTSYKPGSSTYGTKKSNGCSKENRERLATERARKRKRKIVAAIKPNIPVQKKRETALDTILDRLEKMEEEALLGYK